MWLRHHVWRSLLEIEEVWWKSGGSLLMLRKLSGNSNEIVIGFNATGNGTNTITLGNSSTATLFTPNTIYPSNLAGTFTLAVTSGTMQISASTGATVIQQTSTSAGSSVLFVRNPWNSQNFSISCQATNTATGTNYHIGFYNNFSTYQGGITSNNTTNATSYGSASDRRLKKNIIPFQGLPLLQQLQPMQFNMISDKNNIYLYHGFIAQDVLPVLPQYVHINQQDMYEMDYSQLTGIIAQSVLENNALIVSLQTTVKQQTNEITSLQLQLNQVLQRLSTAGIA